MGSQRVQRGECVTERETEMILRKAELARIEFRRKLWEWVGVIVFILGMGWFVVKFIGTPSMGQ